MPTEIHLSYLLAANAIAAAAVLYATRNRKPMEPDDEDHTNPHAPRLLDRRADGGLVLADRAA